MRNVRRLVKPPRETRMHMFTKFRRCCYIGGFGSYNLKIAVVMSSFAVNHIMSG